MENLSSIKRSVRKPLTIKIRPYLHDHHSAGRIIFSAVEIMQLLAQGLADECGLDSVFTIKNASFNRFLYIAPEDEKLDVLADYSFLEDGSVAAQLLTQSASKDGSITRIKEHASMIFSSSYEIVHTRPLDEICAIEGPGFNLKPDGLYSELVPFRSSYRNAVDKIFLSRSGASGIVSGSAIDHIPGPLGSPFPMDAAFHIACAWGQRFHNIVGFPVGFSFRRIFKSAEKNALYHARIFPLGFEDGTLLFDIWIYDMNGEPVEVMLGLRMKDVSGGKARPPEWIKIGTGEENLCRIFSKTRAFAIIELDSVADFSHGIFTADEASRYRDMSDKRKKSYMAARVACKAASRKVSGDNVSPSDSFNTISPDKRPRCASAAGEEYPCSVSHDSRFAVCVSNSKRIGVDVETVLDKAFRSRSIFMNEEEIYAFSANNKEEAGACLRAWSIKECAAKAFGLNLADSWKEVIVKNISVDKGCFTFRGKEYFTYHAEFEGHLFTLFIE